jgi:hypothetical protein
VEDIGNILQFQTSFSINVFNLYVSNEFLFSLYPHERNVITINIISRIFHSVPKSSTNYSCGVIYYVYMSRIKEAPI